MKRKQCSNFQTNLCKISGNEVPSTLQPTCVQFPVFDWKTHVSLQTAECKCNMGHTNFYQSVLVMTAHFFFLILYISKI